MSPQGRVPARPQPAGTAAGPEGTRELLVRQLRFEAEGVVSLWLVDPRGDPLERWDPGSHLDIVLPSGLVRQYSLCGDPDDHRSYQIGVLLEPASRGGSKEIHETALAGRRLFARGPRNHFPLVDASGFLFLAGGIGITPILPMLDEAGRRKTPWHLVYGGRSRSSMAFLGTLDDRSGGTYEILAEDEVGRPDLVSILESAPPETVVYCCGPPGMIAAVESSWPRHLEADRLHVERFTAPVPSLTNAPAGDGAGDGAFAFEVELARSGLVLSVPAERSLLRVLLEAVPSLLYSCEEGYCGTCEVRVVSGEPDHKDTVLTDEERADQKMIVCVGRSKSPRLVLDL